MQRAIRADQHGVVHGFGRAGLGTQSFDSRIGALAGGVPSNFTVPEIDPAVAASTFLPGRGRGFGRLGRSAPPQRRGRNEQAGDGKNAPEVEVRSKSEVWDE